MSDKSIIAQATGRIAAASRKHMRGTPVVQRPGALEDARNELVAAKLQVAIERALSPAPPYEPLRRADRERLARMLLGDA